MKKKGFLGLKYKSRIILEEIEIHFVKCWSSLKVVKLYQNRAGRKRREKSKMFVELKLYV